MTTAAAALHPQQPEDSYSLSVEFRSDSGFKLMLDSLDNRQQRIEVVSVHKEDDVSVAVVHVPPGKMSFFLKRISQYETKMRESDRPWNANLVESIASARLAVVRSFWTDESILFPDDGQPIWWEVWLRCPRGAAGDRIIEAFREESAQAIQLDSRVVRFEERAVLLAWCEPQDWANVPNLMDSLAEMRKAKEPASPYVTLTPADQAAFVQELLSRVTPPPGDSPAVCLLDTGVDWGHPLLTAGMTQASALTVNPNWLPNDHDGHGTEVAGLSLYGCLTKLFPATGPVALAHCLESVKILQKYGGRDVFFWRDNDSRPSWKRYGNGSASLEIDATEEWLTLISRERGAQSSRETYATLHRESALALRDWLNQKFPA